MYKEDDVVHDAAALGPLQHSSKGAPSARRGGAPTARQHRQQGVESHPRHPWISSSQSAGGGEVNYQG